MTADLVEALREHATRLMAPDQPAADRYMVVLLRSAADAIEGTTRDAKARLVDMQTALNARDNALMALAQERCYGREQRDRAEKAEAEVARLRAALAPIAALGPRALPWAHAPYCETAGSDDSEAAFNPMSRPCTCPLGLLAHVVWDAGVALGGGHGVDEAIWYSEWMERP